jgi:hypothetical protein
MAVLDFQALMLPVLKAAANSEVQLRLWHVRRAHYGRRARQAGLTQKSAITASALAASPRISETVARPRKPPQWPITQAPGRPSSTTDAPAG